MEMVREEINLKKDIITKMKQTTIKGDYLIPDVKPDIVKILSINTLIVIDEKEVLDGRIIVQGKLLYRVTYSTNNDELPIRCATFSADFKEWIEDANIKPGMELKISPQVQRTDSKILNERKVSIESIISLTAKVYIIEPVSICTDSDDANTEKLRETKSICECIEHKKEIINISKQREVEESKPSIFEVLCNDTRIECDTAFEDNSLIVKGNLYLTTTYVSDEKDSNITKVKNQIPFSYVLEGATEEYLYGVEVAVNNIQINILEDVMGENRVLGYDIDLEVHIEVYKCIDVEMITDMYSINGNVNIENEDIEYSKICDKVKQTVNVDTNVDVPDISVTDICLMNVNACVLDTTADDGTLKINGVVNGDISFRGTTIMNQKLEMPFECMTNINGCEGKAIANIDVYVQDYSYSKLSDSQINVKVDLKIIGNVFTTCNMKIIKDVTYIGEVESGEDMPNMVLYYTQDGDSVWTVAKKFKVKADTLMEQNNLPNEILEPNKKLLVVK